MDGLGFSVIATVCSGLISSYLLHSLNKSNRKVFVSMQSDLSKLSRKNRGILNFLGYTLAILTSVILSITFNLNSVTWGVLAGFLMAVVDTCFGDNIIGKNISKSKQP